MLPAGVRRISFLQGVRHRLRDPDDHNLLQGVYRAPLNGTVQ